MTLDITKFIANSIRAQAKIQHLDIQTKTVATANIPDSVKKLIRKQYGNKYLLDADYTAFFWGAIDREQIDRLFNVVDKALGKSANRLTNTDFKKIELGSSTIDDTSNEIEDNDKAEDAADDELDNDSDESKEDAVADDQEKPEEDAKDADDSSIDDNADQDENDANEPDKDADEDSDELNEDDETIEVEVTDEKPDIKTSYFFLKITMK